MEATSTFDFVPLAREISANYEEGATQSLRMHDGSVIHLHKLAQDWNPLDRFSAINAVQASKSKGEILTGLLYMNPESRELHDVIETSDKPLNSLTEKELCPGSQVLDGINESFR
jgi:2-oxoglutarate ferredoxin oxidoreductase subunit beta